MKQITRGLLAALACLTLSVAQVAAQDTPATTTTTEQKTEKHQRHMKAHRMHRMGMMKGRMAEELGLTDAQKTQIKSIHEQQRAKAQELKGNASLTQEQKMEQFKALRESTHTQVQGVLTADQQAKFTAMKAKHKERMGKRGKGRRGQWGDKQGDQPSTTTPNPGTTQQ